MAHQQHLQHLIDPQNARNWPELTVNRRRNRVFCLGAPAFAALVTGKNDLNLLHNHQNGSNLAGSWCGPGRFPLHPTLTLNLLR